MSKVWHRTLCALVCLQLVGLLLGSETLRGVGLASVASPLPKVFSASAGLEGFSSRYFLLLQDRDGKPFTLELTSERYAAMLGPYNRRNPYGAVVAFGPQLRARAATRPMFDAVARYALCGKAPLLRELGIDPSTLRGPRVLVQRPRHGTHTELTLELEVSCD